MRNILARIFILVILLTGCQSQTVEPATSTPQPTETRTATATTVHDSLNTAEAKIKLTHSALAKTPSRTPLPTKTSTPTPTPPVPTSLNSNGPWYLFSRMYWGDDKRYSNVLLADFDGSAFTVPNLPPIPLEEKEWTYQVAPSGGLIAFRTSVDNRYPFFVTPNGVDDQIFIVKLPENRVIEKLPLLGEAAWEQAQKDLAGETMSSPVLGIIGDPGSIKWSPDGRYLVYSAAVEGIGTDLYRYNAQTGEVERLTDGQKNSQIWSWMPDGSGFLYRDVLKYDLDYPAFYNTYSGVYLYTDTGSSRQLYVPKGGETIQWIGNNNGLVYQIGLEGYKWNLRELNTFNGRSTELYKDYFTGVTPVSNTRSILLTLSTNVYLMFEDSGVFRVNLDTQQKERVISCSFCYVRWADKDRYILLEQFNSDTNEETHIFYNHKGQEIKRFQVIGNRYFHPSPNRKWAVANEIDPILLRLDNFQQEKIDLLGERNIQIMWQEEPLGYYSLQNRCQESEGICIVRYTEKTGWKSEFIFDIDSHYDMFYVIQP